MWQTAQFSLTHTFTDTHTHREMNKGVGKNFKHLSCAFSVMNNALIETG